MLSSTQLSILIVLVGVFVIAVVYKFYRISRQRRRLTADDNRKAAFSVGGNLVQECAVPITDRYHVTKTLLGRGSSAEVVVGEHLRTNRRFAIKIIDISRKEVVWRYEREKNFLKDLEHTNVVRLYEVYSSTNAMFFVMELCTGGHLGRLLKSYKNGLSEQDAKRYVLQITRAIMHCHQRGICHRDIKLQNILLESNAPDAQVKIVDFGNAVRFRGNTPLTKVVGTTYTAAPEVFRQSYDEKCDLWSLGVVTYILLCGRRPFERLEIDQNSRNKDSSVIASILMGRYHFRHEAWQNVSDEGVEFVKSCLEMDFNKRPSASELVCHPWFMNNKISIPSISSNGAVTLLTSSNRHLNEKNTGMRNASMLAVAFAMPTGKVKQLRDLFQEIDRNGNGVIEIDEFRTAMAQTNPELSSKDVDILFQTMDQDGNGSISFLEFIAATIDPRDIDIREMNQAFRLLDKDQKGYLVKQDLFRLLSTESEMHDFSTSLPSPNKRHHSSTMSLDTTFEDGGSKQLLEAERLKTIQEKVDKIMSTADVNGDGVISYTEFLFAMAEGSSALHELSNIQNLADAPPVVRTYSFLPIFAKKKVTSFEIPQNVARRQSDGNVLLYARSFRLRRPTDSGNTPQLLEYEPKRTWFNSFMRLVSSVPFLTTLAARIQPEFEPVELRGKGAQPVEYLDDSPLNFEKDYRNFGNRSLKTIKSVSSINIEPTSKKRNSLLPPTLGKSGKSLTSPALLSSKVVKPAAKMIVDSDDEDEDGKKDFVFHAVQSSKNLHQEIEHLDHVSSSRSNVAPILPFNSSADGSTPPVHKAFSLNNPNQNMSRHSRSNTPDVIRNSNHEHSQVDSFHTNGDEDNSTDLFRSYMNNLLSSAQASPRKQPCQLDDIENENIVVPFDDNNAMKMQHSHDIENQLE